jgi:hypothetical protein
MLLLFYFLQLIELSYSLKVVTIGMFDGQKRKYSWQMTEALL